MIRLADSFRTRFITVMLIACFSGASVPAVAQEAVIGEVVVTAQKRAQNLLDVPISVSAINAEKMESLEMVDSAAIAAYAPGLSWGGTSNKSKPQIFIRGVGNSDFTSGSNSPVGVYADGVYQGNSFGLASLLLDLDRVEVLRGPQGTLWGKNTTGGVINFISNQASVGEAANGHVSASYGQYDSVDFEGALGAPIGETSAMRFAVGYNEQGGVFEATDPAFRDDDIGGWRWTAARGSLAFEPNEALHVSASATYSKLDGQLRPFKDFGVFDPAVPFGFLPCPLPNPGKLGTGCADAEGFVNSPDIYEVAPGVEPREDVENFSPSLTVGYDFERVSLTSITAYNSSERTNFDDTDNSPSGLLEGSFEDKFHSFSQELRFASSGDNRIDWIGGAYFYEDDLDYFQITTIPVFGPPSTGRSFETQATSYALFGDSSFALTDKLELSAGLRWTRDERDARGLAYFTVANFGGFTSEAQALANLVSVRGDFTSEISKDEDDLSGRVTLQYQLTEDVNLWSTVSRGFKGGDINGGARDPGEFNISDPETLTSYELGLKAATFDRTLQLTASAYYYQYDDAQVFTEIAGPGGNLLILSNAGKLTIRGVDGEASWQPTDRFDLDLGFAYSDSEYDEFFNPGTGVDQAGNTTPYTPELSFNAIIGYSFALGNGGRLGIQGDAVFRDDVFFTSDNNPLVSQPSYWLVGGNVSYISPGEDWEVRLWVRNLADEEYFVGGFDFSFLGGYFMLPGDPRMVGATVSYRF